MPLIPFPNVPNVPGVPNVPRRPAATQPAPAGAPAASKASTAAAKAGPALVYRIVNKAGKDAIPFDVIASFSLRGANLMSKFPVESGGFVNYNKVNTPTEIKVMVASSGDGATSRAAMLSAIEALAKSTELVALVTPDYSYKWYSLRDNNYNRTADRGATLLRVELTFEEVRIAGETVLIPSLPAAQPVQYGGTVIPMAPTKANAALIANNPPK